ncbi:MAG: cytochrome c [Nitrospirota bacterium]|jgi:cytochrome c2
MARGLGLFLVLAWAASAVAAHAAGVPEGERLFRHRCSFCHQFHDLGKEQIGPDLTRVAARMDGSKIARYIRRPQSVEASSRMPRVRGLKDSQIEAIVHFLTAPRVVPAAATKP